MRSDESKECKKTRHDTAPAPQQPAASDPESGNPEQKASALQPASPGSNIIPRPRRRMFICLDDIKLSALLFSRHPERGDGAISPLQPVSTGPNTQPIASESPAEGAIESTLSQQQTIDTTQKIQLNTQPLSQKAKSTNASKPRGSEHHHHGDASGPLNISRIVSKNSDKINTSMKTLPELDTGAHPTIPYDTVDLFYRSFDKHKLPEISKTLFSRSHSKLFTELKNELFYLDRGLGIPPAKENSATLKELFHSKVEFAIFREWFRERVILILMEADDFLTHSDAYKIYNSMKRYIEAADIDFFHQNDYKN